MLIVVLLQANLPIFSGSNTLNGLEQKKSGTMLIFHEVTG
jgi:hypothetical protein